MQQSFFNNLPVGGEIVSTFGRPELVKLGECEVIEEVMIGEDKVSTHPLYFLKWKIFSVTVTPDQVSNAVKLKSLFENST